MHRLAGALRDMGEDVFLWPMPPLRSAGWRKAILRLLFKPVFRQFPGAALPLAKRRNVPGNSIVIYPEIVLGNPLGVANVVRWLLFKPGRSRHPFEFGQDELFFACSDFADEISITGGAQRLTLNTLNPVYQNYGEDERAGSCYMLRKFQGTPDAQLIEGATRLDGLGNNEIVQIFNECKRFYCFDDASMYAQYAAICGCQSIVIPDNYQNRSDWVRDRPIAKYGVAYGLDDTEHADKTRHLVLEHLKSFEMAGLKTVESFVQTTRKHFDFSASE